MGNNTLQNIKLAVIGGLTLINSWLGILSMPLYILIGLNIVDYITGYIAAPYRGDQRNSNKGFRGIAKKVSMWLLVGLGAVVDWLLGYAVGTIGIEIPFKFVVACLVAVWLICNEIISIIENIGDIGVDIPFLRPIIEFVKKGVEKKANIDNKEE